MFIDERDADTYNWEEDGVYLLEAYDPVEGGVDGVSNVQAKSFALRTRNLHNRVKEQEKRITELEALVESLMSNQ